MSDIGMILDRIGRKLVTEVAPKLEGDYSGGHAAMSGLMSVMAGEAAGSIHKVGAHVQQAPSCNGWTFWHYEDRGELAPIDLLRRQYREKMGLT